ncbi:MAG: response regulator transcription factor [Synergistaceae bacterium]|jgi:DNA-binding response OmpR family regulator|nr:response regulator transcription factor [Synergistaceae bacterium]
MSGILVVDDDEEIRTLLRLLLSNANYDVTEAAGGDEALALLRRETFSLVLLDVSMPDRDGFEVGAEMRTFSNVPILYLTARGQEYDKIRGFAAGGDDYLVKPFASSELLARVGALLRRYLQYGAGASPSEKKILSVGELCIDEDACRVTVAGREKKLTAKELEILLLLCRTRGKVFSAENIYESVWNERGCDSTANVVMVHIRKIREKIERNPREPEYLKTVWGMGYKIDY